MTLANAIAQVGHAFPGLLYAPGMWQTPDGSMPYRVLLAYVAMLPAVWAMDRVNAVRSAIIAHGGEHAQRLAAEDLDQAYQP